MVTISEKLTDTKSLPNASATAPPNPETVPHPSSSTLSPETSNISNDADDKKCSDSPVTNIIPSSTMLPMEENCIDSNLDVPTTMDTDDAEKLSNKQELSEIKPMDTGNAKMSVNTESAEETPLDTENTAKMSGASQNEGETFVDTENIDKSISSSGQVEEKCLIEPVITTLSSTSTQGSNEPSLSRTPSGLTASSNSVLLQPVSIPSSSTLQCQNSVDAGVSTDNSVMTENGEGVSQNLEGTDNAQDSLSLAPHETSAAQQASLDSANNDATNSASFQSPKASVTPVTPSKMKVSSCSSKALFSIVEYGISSDSEDENTDSDSVILKVPPYASDAMEIHIDTAGDQDVVVIPPPAKEVIEPPIIDLASTDYRNTIDIGSGTDDSESDSESSSSSTSSLTASSDDSESSLSDTECCASKNIKGDTKDIVRSESRKPPSKKKRNVCQTKGELSLEDLPPIEDLKISVPETLAHVIGFVFNIVEQQVVVQGHRGIPPIDLDSILFLDNGKRALGQIFDVFGAVQEPLYVVRFNSTDHVKEYNINKGDPVYYAPSTEHTSFVVVDELMRIKGSDASGLTGNEILPSEMTDFSDDEEEAKAKGLSKNNKYESSTNEFQSSKKRNCNRARGNEKRNISRGQTRGAGRGTGRMHNPFSERGMQPRPPQPRFDPRCTPGPSRFRGNPPGQIQGPAYANQVDVKVFQNGSSYTNNHWSQPPPTQFGGPPQFSRHIPPPAPPPQSCSSFSPGVQNIGPPLSSFPPPFSPRPPPPPHPTGNFQTLGPPPPSPPCPPTDTPRPYHQTNGFQNMIPQTPPPPCPPSFSPRPPHYPPDAYMGMGGPSAPIGHEFPPPDGNINGGWFNPDMVSQSHLPSVSSHHPLSHPPPPPPPSQHVPPPHPPPFSHPPPSHLHPPPPPPPPQSPLSHPMPPPPY